MDAWQPFSDWIMLTIGVLFIVLEMVTFTFVLFFIGLGFLLTAFVGTFIWPFDNIAVQFLFMAITSGIMVVAFKPWLSKRFGPSKKSIELETFKTGAVGEVIEVAGHLRVLYQGTSYEIEYIPEQTLYVGEKVTVTNLNNNKAIVSKLSS